MSELVHELLLRSAARTPHAEALVHGATRLDYASLAQAVRGAGAALLAQGLKPRERVAIYLEKSVENVAALFGAAYAGLVMVPINPLLKAAQVAHILADCNVRVLVTSAPRLAALGDALAQCPDLRAVMLTGPAPLAQAAAAALHGGVALRAWDDEVAAGAGGDQTSRAPHAAHRSIDADMAAILYTSGSTGRPKGVVLSHRNLVTGAASVAGYLDNHAHDRVLAVLPLSFDYGLSQLTTAFSRGAAVVLLNYLLPRDILTAIAQERITGLAAVPPLWAQLAPLLARAEPAMLASLRYLTNSGGAMPAPLLAELRAALPAAQVFLMYGLTEAFRSTYLPPSELDTRPGSMGRAIPNAEILVVDASGQPCAPGQPGELVHRGALVALGYWNDPVKTAERFRPAPGQLAGLPLPEMAVWSGDTVRADADGYLYFIGRSDEMMKVSGYRISPAEVEEACHASALVREVAAFGVAHPVLGQAIVVVASGEPAHESALLAYCKRHLPAYMVPARITIGQISLPRNPNGKIDRSALRLSFADLYTTDPAL